MGVAQRFAAPPKTKQLCKMGRVLEALDKKDRGAVQAALDGPRPTRDGVRDGWSDPAIAKALAPDFAISDSTVRDHRERACSCFR